MGWHKHLIGFLKVAADAFGMPDLYTFGLFSNSFARKQAKPYFLLPYSLFVDIVLSFPLGTFFLIDLIVYYFWLKLIKLIPFFHKAVFLYVLRYFALYMLGLSLIMILNQFYYCLLFSIIFRLTRGFY